MEQFDWMVLFFAARAAATPDLVTEPGGPATGWSATFRAAARQRTRPPSERVLKQQPDQAEEDVERLAEAVAQARAVQVSEHAVERAAAAHAEREREIRPQHPGAPGPESG